MEIIVWICPKEGCGNYYGSSNAGDLYGKLNYDLKNMATTRRSRCPDCKEDRLPVTFTHKE